MCEAHESHDSSNNKQVRVQGEWGEGEGEDPHSAKEWPCFLDESVSAPYS